MDGWMAQTVGGPAPPPPSHLVADLWRGSSHEQLPYHLKMLTNG